MTTLPETTTPPDETEEKVEQLCIHIAANELEEGKSTPIVGDCRVKSQLEHRTSQILTRLRNQEKFNEIKVSVPSRPALNFKTEEGKADAVLGPALDCEKKIDLKTAPVDCIDVMLPDHLASQQAKVETAERESDIHDVHSLNNRRVAVTGAGGFIASWIVKLLLQRGYHVLGTVRDLDSEEKIAHLRNFEGANERLKLVKADVLDLSSILAVVLRGCDGVFHTACPVIPEINDPEAQMIKPAVDGTLNVLKACSVAQVKRVVMTSSIGAVYIDPNRPSDRILDESCWSNQKYLRDIKEWYCLAKTMAERAAWDYAETHNLDLVSISPPITVGTMLQANLNQSSKHILKYLDGAPPYPSYRAGSTSVYTNLCQAYVNVKDAAEAHLLVYETPTASGRYLCAKWSVHRGELVETLARMHPHYPCPTRCKEEGRPRTEPLIFSTRKIEDLGLQFTPLPETLADAVASLEEKGYLQRTAQPCINPAAISLTTAFPAAAETPPTRTENCKSQTSTSPSFFQFISIPPQLNLDPQL